jgi:hypothetical protein
MNADRDLNRYYNVYFAQPPVGSYSAQAQQTDRGTQEKQARLQEVLKGTG